MMKLVYSLLFTAFSLVLFAASCKKEKTGIDALPPATQEGKNTFGCLINGKVFLPQKRLFNNSSILQCFYRYYDSESRKGYYFNLSAADSKNEPLRGLNIYADSLVLQQDFTYTLKPNGTREAVSGEYTIIGGESVLINSYTTISPSNGELTITRLDMAEQIVSGTFWFDAVNDKGEKVEIREGRFDMNFK